MPLKIGHRGACGYGPENTLLSMGKALDLQVDMIEFDVQVCKSGELVVIHDDRLERTTNGYGYVEAKTLQELKKLKAGENEKIPTLEEALDLIDRKAQVNIELKGFNTAKPVSNMIDQYINKKGWQSGDFLVSSFNHYELMDFKKLSPGIRIGALILGIPIGYAEFAEKIGAYSVNQYIEFLNQEMVDDSHRRGMKIFVYTVNEKEDIDRMKALGVDGIFSNFPDRIA